MIAHAKVAARPSATCAQVEKTASGEYFAATSTDHVPCAVVCWFSEGQRESQYQSKSQCEGQYECEDQHKGQREG